MKYAYIIKCDEVVKDAAGNITELRCTADLDSKTGGATAGRKVKGTIHWVSAAHAIDAEVRLYDRLFTEAEPEKDGRDFKSVLNPHSLEVVTAKCEPSLKDAKPELRYQFERLAYFALDKDARRQTPDAKLVFNRTITLERHLGEGSAEGINSIMKTIIICYSLPLVLFGCLKKQAETTHRHNSFKTSRTHQRQFYLSKLPLLKPSRRKKSVI